MPPKTQPGGVASPSQEGTDTTVKIAKLYDPNRKVELVVYNMERFAKDCVTAFCELSGYPKAKVGTAPTPSLDESKDLVVKFDDPPATGSKGKKNKRPKSPVASKEEQAPDRGKGSGTLPATGNVDSCVQVLDENHVFSTVREARLAPSSRCPFHNDHKVGRTL